MDISLIIGIALVGFALVILALLIPEMAREMDERAIDYDCGYRDAYKGITRAWGYKHQKAYETGARDGFAAKERDALRM